MGSPIFVFTVFDIQIYGYIKTHLPALIEYSVIKNSVIN